MVGHFLMALKQYFYRQGESKLTHLLPLLQDAKKSIFMEYFILEPGLVWQQIFDVLKDKVKQGVDVRIIYDDFGLVLINNQETLKKH